MSNPVILIHGLGLCQGLWRGFVPEIESWGFETLTYDLPGHGQGQPASRPHDLDLYADQLLTLMDQRGWAQAHLVGFSLGGMINRKVALRVPGRVASLAIWNTPHDRGTQQQEVVEARALASQDQGVEATLAAALERWLTPQASPDLRDQIRTWRRACDPHSYAQAAWVLAHGVRELTGQAYPTGLPTQVITCAQDVGSTPAMAAAIARDLGAPPPRLIPDLKHLGLLEQPWAFLEPLKLFLAGEASA